MDWLKCLRPTPDPKEEEKSKKQAEQGTGAIRRGRTVKISPFWGMASEELVDELIDDINRGR